MTKKKAINKEEALELMGLIDEMFVEKKPTAKERLYNQIGEMLGVNVKDQKTFLVEVGRKEEWLGTVEVKALTKEEAEEKVQALMDNDEIEVEWVDLTDCDNQVLSVEEIPAEDEDEKPALTPGRRGAIGPRT